MKINVGSGGRPLAGYVNTDVRALPGVDRVCPAWDLGLPDGVAEELRSTDVIEHFFPKDWPRALAEFTRVLQPGGRIVLSTPDFSEIAHGFVEGRYDIEAVRRTVCATVPPHNSVDYDVPESYHRTAHSEDSLRADLTAAGFADITAWREGPAWNLFVSARKRGAARTQGTRRFVVVVPPSPPGHNTECFREVAESVDAALRALGHECAVASDYGDGSAQPIVFGAHVAPPLPAGSILYNFEPAGTCAWHKTVAQVPEGAVIWDFSAHNLTVWASLGHEAIHVPVGWDPAQSARITPDPDPPIDVLFYGSLNNRRGSVLRALRAAGLRVEVHGGYGAERDREITRAKLVVNIHYADAPAIFESVRVGYLMQNGVAVVSETSVDSDLYDGGFAAAEYRAIVDTCRSLVVDSTARQGLGRKAQAVMEKLDTRAIVAQAIGQTSDSPLAAGSMLGKWALWYGTGQRAESYGPQDTYLCAEGWLRGLAVEDWGCGYAHFGDFHSGPYRGIDGTAGWADEVADLRTYRSREPRPAGILLRHVLEHNPDWRAVLENAVASFKKRMVLVVFTPDAGREEQTLAHVAAVDVNDLALPHAEIENFFDQCKVLDKRFFPTPTGYGGETVWLVER